MCCGNQIYCDFHIFKASLLKHFNCLKVYNGEHYGQRFQKWSKSNSNRYPIKLKPPQNKKGQKNLGDPRKKKSFSLQKDCFFLGTPNFFGPSYFDTALPLQINKI